MHSSLGAFINTPYLTPHMKWSVCLSKYHLDLNIESNNQSNLYLIRFSSPRVDVMWTTGAVNVNNQQRTHHFHHFTHQQQQQQQAQQSQRLVRHDLHTYASRDHHNLSSSMEDNNTGEEEMSDAIDEEEVVEDVQPHRRRHHLHKFGHKTSVL